MGSLTSPTPDATTTSKGKIQLAGGVFGSTSTAASPQFANGVVVQMVSTNFNAAATGATIIPADDTIPQNTEGDQYMTQAITPKATTNQLIIEATLVASNTAALSDMLMALFQDSTANALACSFQTFTGSTYVANIYLRHVMSAGTTSSTTFKIRAGAANAGTTTFNGQSGTRRQGGVTVSNLKITEYKA